MALAVACSALTTWVYPYHEKELVALSATATIPLIARNLLFACLVALLQIEAWQAGRQRSTVSHPVGQDAGVR